MLLEVGLALVELRLGIALDRLGALRQEVPAPQQQVVGIGATGVALGRAGPQAVQVLAELAHRRRRPIGCPPQPGSAVLGDQPIDALAQQRQQPGALALGALDPGQRHVAKLRAALLKQRRDGLHAPRGRLQPLRDRREGPPQQADHAKGRLAGVEAGVGALEVRRAKLPALDLQKAHGQLVVDRPAPWSAARPAGRAAAPAAPRRRPGRRQARALSSRAAARRSYGRR